MPGPRINTCGQPVADVWDEKLVHGLFNRKEKGRYFTARSLPDTKAVSPHSEQKTGGRESHYSTVTDLAKFLG